MPNNKAQNLNNELQPKIIKTVNFFFLIKQLNKKILSNLHKFTYVLFGIFFFLAVLLIQIK